MSTKFILLFVLGIGFGSIGGILLRYGAKQLPDFSVSLNYFIAMFTNIWIIMGYILYFIPALIWTYILTKYPIGFVQPIMALTYVLTPILGIFLLKEGVPIMRWIGIIVIIIGVYIVSKS